MKPHRVGLLLIVALFLLYCWPTLYRYDTSQSVRYRTNRVTGHVALLTPVGWYGISTSPPRGPRPESAKEPSPASLDSLLRESVRTP